MNYSIEQLLPIVIKLSEKFTSKESTSITYEHANQLMEAVLYCINEYETYGEQCLSLSTDTAAETAYSLGYTLAENKVRKALQLYNELLPGFDYYGNICLYDTVIKGMPEFFKWYDLRFNPQDTILTLDYPLTVDLSGYTGIDKIYEYLRCIQREQEYLSHFDRTRVIALLAAADPDYTQMIDNLYDIVLKAQSPEK